MFGELVTDIFQTLTSCSLHSIGPACPWSGRGDWCRALAAVVLLVVVQPELEAVVAPADQVAPAAPVSVILAAVPGPVTVPLPLPTRGLRSAAPPPIEVSPSTSLTWNINERLHGYVNLWSHTTHNKRGIPCLGSRGAPLSRCTGAGVTLSVSGRSQQSSFSW